MKFSIRKMFLKGLKYFVLFGLPIIVDKLIISYPKIAQLTLGGVLVMIVNWLKVKTQYFGLVKG